MVLPMMEADQTSTSQPAAAPSNGLWADRAAAYSAQFGAADRNRKRLYVAGAGAVVLFLIALLALLLEGLPVKKAEP